MSEPRKERKVVTVVFADLVGFTSRAETLDPEDVEAILRPYHERVRTELERYGGTVEKFIGDAVMAVFGAPVAHEDDPERAVRAALAIRDWALDERAVDVRIGVNTGEALVSLDARPDLGEGLVAGDVVNTAARLQTAAAENSVVVGETTWHATEHVIEYIEAQLVEAKGKAQPVAVRQAIQARARFGVDVRQTSPAPLVGRERERGLLLDTFARVRSDRSPQLVTLVGVPGIGKSRLVYALFEALEQGAAGPELVMWRQGRCLPYGEGVSFWALAEIVKAQSGILEDDPREVAKTKLAEAVRAVLDESDARWAELLLRPLIGVEAQTEIGGDTRDEAFSAWRRFVEGLAEQRPLVLVIEDLHWADEGLLDFVDHLIDWANDVPLLVLCTARPELLERRPGWGGGKLNALTLALGPLQPDDSARLIAGVLDQAVLPAETQRALLDRAGGNPLYAEQYARLYLERGSVDDLPLPETVQGLIAARLDALPAEEKVLLQDAAVMGKVFWSGALGGNGSRRDRLHALERKEFVRRERRSSVAGEDEYAFRHVLVRDVAYGQIPRAARAAKHRGAAEWIEALGRPQDHAELLAYHYLAAFELARAAGQETSELAERARVASREAGDRAVALNAYEAAVGFYSSALELVTADDRDRPQLLFRLGRARFMGEEEGDDVLTEAASALLAAGDREAAAEAETLLVELAWKRAQRDEAFRHLDRAVELVAERPPSRAKAFVLSTKSRYLMLAGENVEGIARGQEALAMAEELGLDEIRAHALNNIGVCRYIMGDDRGIADLEQSIDIARAIDSPEVLRGYTNLIACLNDGGVTEIARVRREAMSVAERFGQRGHLRWLGGGLSWELYALGEWDEALRVADEFVQEAQESPHYLEGANRIVRAVIGVARGDDASALDDTERALAQARTAKDPQAIYPALTVRANVLMEMGDLAAADRLAAEVFADLAPRVPGLPLDAGATLAELALALGRENELRSALAESQAARRRSAELATAIVDGDYADAAELAVATGHRALEARIRLLAAQRLAAEGRHAEAEAEARSALDFYRSVGGSRYIREAEALLRESA